MLLFKLNGFVNRLVANLVFFVITPNLFFTESVDFVFVNRGGDMMLI